MQGAVCIPNIGVRGQKMRLIGGVAMTIGAAALLAVLLYTDAPRWGRILVFFPALAGALGVLQAREKT
jgi:hypothetical protein